MNKYFILFSVLLIFFCCYKEEDLDIDREVENYSSEHFKTFDIEFSMSDVVVDAGGRYIFGGSGHIEVDRVDEPAIVIYDPSLDTAGIRLLRLDNEYGSPRRVHLAITAFDDIFISTSTNSNSDDDFEASWVLLDRDLNRLWRESISLPGFDLVPISMVVSGFVACVTLNGISKNRSRTDQYQLTRISDRGQVEWEKTITEPYLYSVNQIMNVGDQVGQIILTEYVLSGEANWEFGLRKIDGSGNTIWTIRENRRLEVWYRRTRMAEVEDGHLIVMFPDEPDTTKVRGIGLIKFDSEGNEIWKRNLPGRDSDLPAELILTTDGNYVLLSSTTSFGNDESNVMLTKLDTSGNIIWDKVFGGDRSDQGRSLIEKENGNLMVFGNTNEGGERNSDFNFFILETDADGRPIE